MSAVYIQRVLLLRIQVTGTHFKLDRKRCLHVKLQMVLTHPRGDGFRWLCEATSEAVARSSLECNFPPCCACI